MLILSEVIRIQGKREANMMRSNALRGRISALVMIPNEHLLGPFIRALCMLMGSLCTPLEMNIQHASLRRSYNATLDDAQKFFFPLKNEGITRDSRSLRPSPLRWRIKPPSEWPIWSLDVRANCESFWSSKLIGKKEGGEPRVLEKGNGEKTMMLAGLCVFPSFLRGLL